MPNNVQAWVRDKKPKSLVEAGKSADDYMRNRKLEEIVSSRETTIALGDETGIGLQEITVVDSHIANCT